MKITCECKESINIHKTKDPTLLVDWNEWICDHLFRHSAIYSTEGDPFKLTFRPSTAEGGPVTVFEEVEDAGTGEKKLVDVSDRYDHDDEMVSD